MKFLFRGGGKEKVKLDSLQKDLIPAFLYSCSLRISLLSSNSTGNKEREREREMKAVKSKPVQTVAEIPELTFTQLQLTFHLAQ